MKNPLRAAAAAGGGFALSFVGLGVLWIGTPWAYQCLMLVPFLLLAFAVTRTGDARDNTFVMIIFGAAPLGGMITLFRDKHDSHVSSILTVCAWLAGILAGHFWARRLRGGLSAGPGPE